MNFQSAAILALSVAILSVVLSVTISITLLRRGQKALPHDPQQAPEQDRLLRLNRAIEQMLELNNLEDRLRLLAVTLREFGWGRVTITLRDKSPLIVEPANSIPTPDDLIIDQAWQTRWEKQPPAELTKYRVGPGYFFTKLDIDATEGVSDGYAWLPGDLFAIPIRFGNGLTVAVIKLFDPTNGQRPTSANTHYVTILAAQARAAIESSQLVEEVGLITQQLEDQIEELVMMQHVDRELAATLDFDAVMMLTMDWAIRRTGASAGMLNMVTPDGTGLFPVAALGYSPESTARYSERNPLPLTQGVTGRAVRTRQVQIIADTQTDPEYIELLDTTRSEVAVPMEMRGGIIGVLNLESEQVDAFDNLSVPFITRLAARAAVALDNARLYREAESRADQMSALYSAGRSVSSSLERADVLKNIARSLAGLLDTSYTVVADYSPERSELVVSAFYRANDKPDTPELPVVAGTVIELGTYPDLQHTLNAQRAIDTYESDQALPETIRSFLVRMQCKALLMVPMLVQDRFLGVVMALEQRRERIFTQDEILLAESLASQSAAALRQATLYEDVRELENVKTEMIRMASHDLRNPLGNLMGYFEILVSTLDKVITSDQTEYVAYVRNSTEIMRTLIEDLLTLDRLESERQIAWIAIDFKDLVAAEIEGQKSSAELKQQTLTLFIDHADNRSFNVLGSKTQLRQAVANLVGNAIKYTPADGNIQAKLTHNGKHILFEVEDTGYGISPERQVKLFQRFYRAREVSTEHIPGTGLGLSMVKTVVERHGGEVWVHSELGVGSTFGFWLPIPPASDPALSGDTT